MDPGIRLNDWDLSLGSATPQFNALRQVTESPYGSVSLCLKIRIKVPISCGFQEDWLRVHIYY